MGDSTLSFLPLCQLKKQVSGFHLKRKGDILAIIINILINEYNLAKQQYKQKLLWPGKALRVKAQVQPQVFGPSLQGTGAHSSALFAVLSVAILGVPGAPPASVSLAVRAKRALRSTDVAAPLSQ